MIRVSPGLEQNARNARYLYGIRLMVVGTFRDYILGKTNDVSEKVLLAVGTEEAQQLYRSVIMGETDPGAELQANGSVVIPDSVPVVIKFARSFADSAYDAAFDPLDRIDRQRIPTRNEKLFVYVGG